VIRHRWFTCFHLTQLDQLTGQQGGINRILDANLLVIWRTITSMWLVIDGERPGICRTFLHFLHHAGTAVSR